MPKLRKMLGSADSPYILPLMKLIETQNKTTIANWCIDYAAKYFLPIYEKSYPKDERLINALQASKDLIMGNIKAADAKKIIKEATAAAKEAEENPAACAAAKAVGQAAGAIYTPTHSLGLAFYGAAAIAYDRVGVLETAEVYEQIASEECAKLEAALRKIYVENEPNPVKINWYC